MLRPIPIPDEISKPFWDAANERRLVVQRCTTCDRMQYPPEPKCYQCGSAESLVWQEVSGRGNIDDYIVIHDSRLRSYQEDQPYNVAIIQIEEDPDIQFFSNLPGTPVDEVPVGAPVEVVFVEGVAPGQLIPEWQLASQAGRP